MSEKLTDDGDGGLGVAEVRPREGRAEDWMRKPAARRLEPSIPGNKDPRKSVEVERLLWSSEQQFLALATGLDEGVATLDPEDRVQFCNAAAEAILGVHPGELLGKNLGIFFPSEDAPGGKDGVGLRFKEGGPARAVAARRADGELRWLRVTSSCQRDLGGCLTGTLVIFSDITDQRREDEETLRVSQRLAAIVASMPILLYVRSARTGLPLTWVSSNAEKITGYTSSQFVFSPLLWRKQIHPEDSKRFSRALRRLLEKGTATVDYRVLFADRLYHWVLDTMTLVKSPAGDPLEITGCVMDITEQKLFEVMLQDSQEQYRQLVDLSPDAVLLADMELNILFSNRQAARLVGLDRSDEALGHNAREFISPEERQAFEKALQTLSGRGVVSGAENTLITKQGRRIPVEWRASIARDDQGNPTAIVAVVRDVSARKRSEAALRESETRFRRLFERNPAGSFRATPGGVIEEANASLAGMLGYGSPGRLKKKNLTDLAADPASFERLLEALRQGEPVTAREISLKKPDGGVVYALTSASLLAEEATESPSIEGSMIDITGRREAEDQLRLFQMAVEQSPSAILIVDPHGDVLYVNRAFEEMTGYTAGESVGRPWRTLGSERYDQALVEGLIRTVTCGGTWHRNFTAFRKDGSPYEESTTVTPMLGSCGRITHFVAVRRDVTEQVALENKLQGALRMEAVGRLAGGVAHDFNNLMHVVLTATELLQNRLSYAYPRAKEDLLTIARAAQSASELTRSLLAFARQQHLERSTLDLNRLSDDMMPMLQRLLPASITVHLHKAEGPSLVYADPSQIERIVLNLCVNARDAMPEGGQIHIDVGHATLDEAYLSSHPWARAGRFAMIRVADTGKGIAPEILGHLFEPFFTTKESGKGSGLGLSTVYGIVKQHEGFIDVQAAEGSGAQFTVYLPPAERPAAPRRQERTGPAPDGHETVLITDDREDLRRLLSRSLRAFGYSTLEAHDAEEALAILRTPGATVDLLITDLVLPGLGGDSLASAARQVRPGLPVLLCSGFAEEIRRRVNESGEGLAFLPKPFDIRTLANKVRELLDATSAGGGTPPSLRGPGAGRPGGDKPGEVH